MCFNVAGFLFHIYLRKYQTSWRYLHCTLIHTLSHTDKSCLYAMFSQITHHSYANGLLDASESRLPHIIIYMCSCSNFADLCIYVFAHAQILPIFEHVGQNTMQFYIFRDFLRGCQGAKPQGGRVVFRQKQGKIPC